MEPADWFDDGGRMGLRKNHIRKILKRTLRRWMGKSVRSQEWKIVEKVMKLKLTGYRFENSDYGQDWMENKRRAERRPRRPRMSSSDPGVVEPCRMDQEIGKLATR